MFVVATRLLGALAVAFAALEAAAQQLATDMKLEDAGFVMRRADTPAKIERLRLLPALKFASRTGPNGKYYLFADPDVCKCVFVGDGRAMQAFRDMRAKIPQPDNVPAGGFSVEQQMISDMNADGIDPIEGDILDYRFQ